IELLALAAFALAIALVFMPDRSPRRRLALQGGAGLAGTAAVAAVPTFDLALLVLVLLAVFQAALEGRRPTAACLKAPGVAVALLALAAVFARVGGPELIHRFAAVGLGAGLAAALGLLPYLHVFDPEEPVTASPIGWLAFVGPVLAAVIVAVAPGGQGQGRDRAAGQPPRGGGSGRLGAVRRVRRARAPAPWRDAAVLAARACAGPRHAAVAAGLAAPGPEHGPAARQAGPRCGARARAQR